MKRILTSLAILPLLFFTAGSLRAGDPSEEGLSKLEKEYRHFIKDHVGYNLLTVEHDKFKKHTKISMDTRMTNETGFERAEGGGLDMDLLVYAVVPDEPSDEDRPMAFLMLIARGKSGDDWRYLKCHDFNWLVDNEPLPIQDTDYDTHIFNDASTNEYFTLVLTQPDFEKLAKSQSAEAKICNDEFVFVKKQMFVIRWVNEQMRKLLGKPIEQEQTVPPPPPGK